MMIYHCHTSIRHGPILFVSLKQHAKWELLMRLREFVECVGEIQNIKSLLANEREKTT